MEPEGSLSHLQVPATCPYPEQNFFWGTELTYMVVSCPDFISAELNIVEVCNRKVGHQADHHLLSGACPNTLFRND
jgi:hypothetical protein